MPLQRIFQKKALGDEVSPQIYIQQLFKMAHSDGHMDECEYHFILKVAQRFEIEVDFESLHEDLDNLTFDATSSDTFGFDLLFDLSWLILVDGEIDEKELQFGSEVAAQMGFQPHNVKEMVEAIGNQKRLGLPPLEIKDKLRDQFPAPSNS